MKGMNTTLVLNEQPSRNHYILRDKLNRSCIENDVPYDQKGSLVKAGLELFSMDAAGLHTIPKGKHATVNDFVKAHRDNTEHHGDSNLTKTQLYDRLVKAAETGSTVEYRHLRKQYLAA